MENRLPKRWFQRKIEAMNKTLKWFCALALIALANGCATHGAKTAESKKTDSVMEQPAANSGTEIHGSISVGVGGRIK
jgi:hypothetical protein